MMENQAKDKSIEELIHIVNELTKEVSELKTIDEFRREAIDNLKKKDESKDEKINNIEKNVLKMSGDLDIVVTFVKEQKEQWKANDATKKNNIYKIATDLLTSLLKWIGILAMAGFAAKNFIGGK
jgi:hypothetical protein